MKNFLLKIWKYHIAFTITSNEESFYEYDLLKSVCRSQKRFDIQNDLKNYSMEDLTNKKIYVEITKKLAIKYSVTYNYIAKIRKIIVLRALSS